MSSAGAPPDLSALKELKVGSSTHFQSATTRIWLLGFHQCQPISMDENRSPKL